VDTYFETETCNFLLVCSFTVILGKHLLHWMTRIRYVKHWTTQKIFPR